MIKYLDLKSINGRHDAELRRAIDGVLRSGWYLRGEATRRFEEHYAEYIGTRYCVGCGNGLDALSLILRAYIELGVMREGDEVIVPANTFIATILAITGNRLVPVLVEPDIATLQIDDRLIEEAVTPRTRAVIIVHLYGRCAYTERVGDVCRRHGLKLIEDNAQAHGCRFPVIAGGAGEGGGAAMVSQLLGQGEQALERREQDLERREQALERRERGTVMRRTGSLGDAAGHSFYPGKNLGALGDAGAVTTDDGELAERIRMLGNYGSRRKYVHECLGENSRMDELQAAVLDVKLRYLEEENERRKAVARVYMENVENGEVTVPQCGRDSVWHIFPVLSRRRDELQGYLLDRGVETQVHYPIAPHRQGCYGMWGGLSLPVTERIAREELSLPCNPGMTLAEAEYVAGVVNQFK